MKLLLLLLISFLYKINGQGSIMCDLTSLIAEDFHNGASDGHAGDCSDSLQEGDTCTPVCGTNWEVDVDASCGEVNGAIEFIPAVCVETTCVLTLDYANGNQGECTEIMDPGTLCSPDCDAGYEPTGASDGQTQCVAGDVFSKAQCTDINECNIATWQSDADTSHITHSYTNANGVCGLHGTCTNKDLVADGVGYTCACDDGFDGTYCLNDIDDCAGTPCHAGTCTDGYGGISNYTCSCYTGWSGSDCDVGAPCTRSDPVNGLAHNCSSIDHGQYCNIQCNAGYYVINGVGGNGNDLCWAGDWTGQAEFSNIYTSASCEACPTATYTTQINSVIACNTFSWYISGSIAEGISGSECPDGYHFIEGTDTADSQCNACPTGEYSIGGAACQTCTDGKQAQLLDSGYDFTTAGGIYCVQCQDGFDNDGSTQCTTCTNGKYSANGDVCAVCPDTQQSQSSDDIGINNYVSDGADRCVTCQNGYQNLDGGQCDICTNGQYSANGDVCATCPNTQQGQTVDDILFGNYASTGADRCVTCQNGYQNLDGEQCDICTTGQYSANGDACAVCPDKQQSQSSDDIDINNYVDEGADRCITCQNGYDNIGGVEQCDICTNGKYSANGDACAVCPDGEQGQTVDDILFGNYVSDGADRCITCQDGYDNTDGENCEICVQGYYSTNGTECTACPLGEYATSQGTLVCDKCPLGTFMGMETPLGQTSDANCVVCLAGSYGPTEGLHNSPNGGNPCTGCPFGSWSPTFDASDTDNPNHPNPPSAPEHCRDCPIHTYGASEGLISESECSDCPLGKDAAVARAASCDNCTIGKFSDGGECETCPEGYFTSSPGQSVCLDGSVECVLGEELVPGDENTPDTCQPCNYNTSYSPEGSNVCVPKTLTCIRGLQNIPSGNNYEDNVCLDIAAYDEFDPESYDIDDTYWQSMSDLCHFQGKFALLSEGHLVCVPCSYNLFKYEFEMSNADMDVSALPDNQKAARHGKCCYNTHHRVCQKMLQEYQKRCQTDEKGTVNIELQPCDINPLDEGCPPSIIGSAVSIITTTDQESDLMSKYSCTDGNGNANPNWLEIHGIVSYGVAGTYNIILTCTKSKTGGVIDAIALPVNVRIVEYPIQTVNINYDESSYNVCEGDIANVVFDANHNVYEVTDHAAYDSCDSTGGTELHGYQNSGSDQVDSLRTDYGDVRYFICEAHCNLGKKFKVFCGFPNGVIIVDGYNPETIIQNSGEYTDDGATCYDSAGVEVNGGIHVSGDIVDASAACDTSFEIKYDCPSVGAAQKSRIVTVSCP